jgi:hypothetical protein
MMAQTAEYDGNSLRMSTVSRHARRNCVTSVSKLYENMPHARPQSVRPRVAVGKQSRARTANWSVLGARSPVA